jgi:periplasmic divalent cation tolerance protein
MEHIVIFITASSAEEAEKISNALVENKLVACSNIVSPIRSIFHWQGEICKEDEVLLILKSVKTKFTEIVDAVKKLHSYETPEIIALPIIDGSPEYLQWVSDETK